MTNRSRVLVLVASLALGLVFVLPLWRIDLEAPQYPEGIGMRILVNTITGRNPNDLSNLNGLNHYIGMKPIEPDSIPELRWMPWILGGLIGIGLLTAATRSRALLLGWVAAFFVLAGVGLVDYYRWGYDYGHDLNPKAAIKVPGMAYQPPLIGSKKLLNFTSHSWPAAGGWIVIGSLLVISGVAVSELRRRGRGKRAAATPPASVRPGTLLVAAALAAVLAGCEPGPQPIRVGEDRCAFCLMGIAEAPFAGELVTRRGRIHTFDSVECLAAYVNGRVEESEIASAWVTDFTSSPALIDATAAAYLRSDGVRSPMGLGLAAFASTAARDSVQRELGGDVLDWQGVRAAVREAWPDGTPHMGRHGGAAGTAEVDAGGRVVDAMRPGALAEAIVAAAPGERIVVRPGHYREPTLVIEKPVELVGQGYPVLDGEGKRPLIVIRSDGVTIRGLTLRDPGRSNVEDRAAIRVERARNCRIEGNRIEKGYFGIYLASVADCLISGNRIESDATRESTSGNGIHVWYSRGVTIRNNVIRGHRDGLYFEFAKDVRVEDNVSEGNVRYGLHFMFSDSSTYRRNLFRANGAGVAVMYTAHVDMEDNRFLDNWGPATFGLLLKDIRDSRIAGNRFERNTVGIHAEGSDRMRVERNAFHENGWAVKLMANSEDNRFEANDFSANSFDVSTNSRQSYSEFAGNYWDEYRGYDLDRDGRGDVAYRPVRLFSLVVEQNEPALILLRSFLVSLLDAAEAVIPALTPETLVDAHPRMRPVTAAANGGGGG